MKISYNWLKQFFKLDIPAEEVGVLLTDLGLEVEGIEKYESVKGGLNGVVVGQVLTCVQHPNADRLKVTTVNIGTETLQIVCGAPNVAEGQKVCVATIGTILYDDKGESFEIKKGKIRGEDSFGMLCGPTELGLGEETGGLLILDDKLAPGTPLAEVYQIENDEVFEIGLTPNRADAMSHFGVARDLRAGLLQQNKQVELITPSVSSYRAYKKTLKVKVKIENNEFVEWEMVYEGKYYGTLKSEVEKIWNQGKVVIFDVDVKGGISLKKYFGEQALSIFIEPPSIEELERRLISRNTDDAETIRTRVAKAEEEMSYAKEFDKIVINKDLDVAKKEIESLIKNFIGS